MKCQLETIGQEFLHQFPELHLVWHALYVRLPGNIEPVRLEPRRSAKDLTRMHAKGERHQVAHAGIDREDLAATYHKPLALQIMIARFNRYDFEARVGVRGHGLQRRRGRGDGPRRFGSSAREIELEWFPTLRERAGN